MFTCSIQLVGYDANQFDEKGEVSYTDVFKILDEFPWLEQFNKWNDIKTGYSASIFVVDSISGNSLWVSIAEKKNNLTYLMGIVYLKIVTPFLGLGKKKHIKWVDVYEISELSMVKEFFRMFFNNNHGELMQELSLEKKFDSMKVADGYPY